MSFELALRLTELVAAFAILQHSLEHLVGSFRERLIFGLRGLATLPVLAGVATDWGIWAMLATSLWALHRFQGPYNGGADRMALLVLICLSAAHLVPDQAMAELALAYLAAQLVLSYVMSGWVKIANPDWRSGTALCDVFRYSAYPVSEGLRAWAESPRILWAAGWAIMLFEVAFVLALAHPLALAAALVLAAAFHLANACLFGLNRFFWIWPAAYPSLLWLQGRVLGSVWG